MFLHYIRSVHHKSSYYSTNEYVQSQQTQYENSICVIINIWNKFMMGNLILFVINIIHCKVVIQLRKLTIEH